MSIEAISAISAMITPPVAPAVDSAPAASGNFATWFDQQLADVNQQLAVADQGLQSLATGDARNLHQVMIQMEQAKLSVQLFVQVRNHLLEAYQDVMRMQM